MTAAPEGPPRGLAVLRRVIGEEVEDVNRLIYHALLTGTIGCVTLVLAALVAFAATGGPMPARPVPIADLIGAVERGSPAGILSLGLLVLILTPVARVTLSVLHFARDRDGAYAVITLIVLTNLLLGLLLGVG